MKKLLTAVLSIALLLCAFPFAAAASEPSDDEAISSLELTVLEGASIRKTEGTTGIRFDTTVNKAAYDALVSEGYTLTHGTLIVPRSYLSIELGSDTNLYDALKNSGKTVADVISDGFYTPEAEDPDFVGIDTDTVYVYRTALTNLRDHNYLTEFVPLSYILVEKNGVRVETVTDEGEARSIYDVASSAFTAGETDGIVCGFVDSILDITVDRFGNIAQTDVTGNAKGKYAPTYANDVITVSQVLSMKCLRLNGAAISIKALASLDCVSIDGYTESASITLSSLRMLLETPTAEKDKDDVTASLTDIADAYYNIESTAASKADVEIRAVNKNDRYTTVSFSFQMEKPSVISEGDRTVMDIVLYRANSIGASAYKLTVEAYDSYFRFGDDNASATNSKTGEFDQNFAYDTWYTVQIVKAGSDSAPKWTMTYGVGRCVEATNAVTYGGAAFSNNFYDHNGSGYATLHGLRFMATAEASFTFSLDGIVLSSSTLGSLTLDCFSTDAARHTTNPNGIDLTGAGTTVHGGTLSIYGGAQPSDSDYHYASADTQRPQLILSTDAVEGWNVAVIDFKMRINGMSSSRNSTRGLTFYLNAEDNRRIMKKDISVKLGSSSEEYAIGECVRFDEWAQLRFYYVFDESSENCQLLLYINGALYSSGSVGVSFTRDSARFSTFVLENFSNTQIDVDVKDFTASFYNMK